MDIKDKTGASDDEHFEDANEKIVNELIGQSFDEIPKHQNHDNENYDEDENEAENFHDCELNSSDLIDDESQRDFEKDQTDEERENARLDAVKLKNEGNEEFRNGNYEKSIEIYTSALRKCPVACSNDRSMIYGNRAVAKIKLGSKPAAIEDCSKAIEFNPTYIKVLLR